MKAQDIYHKIKAIAEDYHAYTDQLVAIAKWIEAEFDYNPQKLATVANRITQKELQEYGAEMMKKYPAQKELIFVAVDDSFNFEDGDEKLQKLKDWITDICTGVNPESNTSKN